MICFVKFLKMKVKKWPQPKLNYFGAFRTAQEERNILNFDIGVFDNFEIRRLVTCFFVCRQKWQSVLNGFEQGD